MTLTQEDLKNLILIVNAVSIKGVDALPVAVLLQKLNTMHAELTPAELPVKEESHGTNTGE